MESGGVFPNPAGKRAVLANTPPAPGNGHSRRPTKVQELQQRVRELSILLDVASQVAGPAELSEVLGALLSSAANALDLQVCFVCLFVPGSDLAKVAASWVRGRSPQLQIKDTTIRFEDHPLVRLGTADSVPIVLRNVDDPRLTAKDRQQMLAAGCSSALVVPARARGKVVALLALSWEEARDITANDERLACALADLAGMSIQRAQLYSEELAASYWLRLLLDSLPAAVYCVDSDRRLRWLSRAAREMVGAGSSIPEGIHCYDLVQLADAKGNDMCRDRCPAMECFRTRQLTHTDDVYVVRRDGQRIAVTKTDAYAPSPSGEPLVIGITMDASYRREADEFRDSLVSIVSHEFRTPLQHIKGFATSLLRLDVQWDAATQHEFLEGIDRETDRLTVLVSNLLDLSRLEAGHQIFSQKADCDSLDLVRKALERAAPFTQDHPVNIRLPSRSKPLFVESDQLERVLVNLLENAAKFSLPAQPIALEVKNRKGGVEFHVRDRGRGISPEDQARLFEKFSRARSVGGVRGAGLGLAICKAFIELNRGRIWLERSSPGKGSDFAFWIPTHADPPAAHE